MLVTCAVQALLSVVIDGQGPVRFGVPLPAASLQRGLRLQASGEAVLQWRKLQPLPDPATGCQWVELAIVGAPRRVGVAAGGAGPDSGLVYVHSSQREMQEQDEVRTDTWTYVTGDLDRRQRRTFGSDISIDDELFGGGESLTSDSAALSLRAHPVLRLPRRLWARAQVLPESGGQARQLQKRLVDAADLLVELPGRRGRGDFGRSEGIVTNLEYDTTLAFAQLALATGELRFLQQAQRCARHTLDRDLDHDTGLPFQHGLEHRTGTPQPGHCWLRGMLLVGCLCADDELLDGARALARALAQHPPSGEGLKERARDYAWPLWEMEAYLAFEDEPMVRQAADRLAASIALRFDAARGTFCFGEGEVEGHGSDKVYFERAWITAGLVLPALRAHLRRRPGAVLQHMLAEVQQHLLDALGNGEPGIPTHWRTLGGKPFAQHRAHDDPCAGFWLEGLSAPELRRLLRKGGLWRTLGEIPAFTDDDLATSFTMLARCSWVYR